MLRLLAGATAFLAALGPLLAQAPESPDARQVHWQRRLDDALALAKARNAPLFLAVNMDGESASDRIVHENYRDPAFVALTRCCVCLGASVFRHNARDHDDEGRRIPCPRFGEITCGEHMALEPVLFEKYLADGERVAPRHALILPDGRKVFDLSLCFDLQDIDRALALAVQGLPAGVRANQVVPPIADVAEGAGDWDALAARRDARGRQALESALARVQDETTLAAALAGLGRHGDQGALEALRLVAARLPALRAPLRAHLLRAADGAGVARAEWFAALQELAQRLRVPDDPGPDPRQQVLLQELAAIQRDATPAQRHFLLACCADSSCSARVAGPPPGNGAGDAAAGRGRAAARAEPVRLRSLLQTANAVSRREAALPQAGGPTDAMPPADELAEQLDRLDAEPKERRGDPEWLARYAKVSLDLGRRHIDSGQRDAQLLLEDAAQYFDKALQKAPDRYEWWIERARAAYFLQRFADEVDAGRRAYALAAGAEQLPGDGELLASPVLHDARAIEALRWVGDGAARLLGAGGAGDAAGAATELALLIDALRALGIVAASPFGGDQDWVSLASFCRARGLLRQAEAVAQCGAMRYPASRDLRQELDTVLWQCGRPDLVPAVAEALERAHAPSADAAWFCGYAWILAGEDARRREVPEVAVRAYEAADAAFGRAAAGNPAYADNCGYLQAAASVGQGMARAGEGDRHGAVDCLADAVRRHGDLSQLRDGLGCDVLDLVDRILEWRASGPSEVEPRALLDRLDEVAPGDPFWAVAVSDSALREALRADGRNPERRERRTVDAAGNEITMPMGLPTPEGDRYLQASIAAGRRAVARARTDADKQPLAQSDTIWAERRLERAQLDGVREALAEAAPLLGLAPPAADAGEADLRALAARLRGLLGDARPRLREGR